MAVRGINKVILVGRLGKDPEVRYIPNGGAVANLQVAQVIQGRRWRPPVSPRENPWQADACRKGSGPR